MAHERRVSPSRKPDLHILLKDPELYLDQIDRLHVKNSHRNRLYELSQGGVPLASLCLNRTKVARTLAQAVSEGRYETQPARLRWVTVKGKRRKLYQFQLTDLIVHGVVAGIIDRLSRADLSGCVYSYQKGVHWWQAASNFARYVRAHARQVDDPRRRGLFVLRRDIRDYTDSIPVSEGSPVWPRLGELLGIEGDVDSLTGSYWHLIQQVIRPVSVDHVGCTSCNTRGVPTGSPISTSLFNYYLMPLDRALGGLEGGFYARYSDDILFAHPDPGNVETANETITSNLDKLGLATNPAKDRHLFFNGAGRPAEPGSRAHGTVSVSFLGCEVSFSGEISLKRKKARVLLREIRERLRRTLKALPEADLNQRGRVVCAAVNETLDPKSPCSQKSAILLRHLVTNRAQLKQLDYAIARMIAGGLCREDGVKAFRVIPYRRLRKEWRLVSLTHQRNLV